MLTQNNNTQYAYLGGGCFWCIEAVFQNLKGVESVVSGYSGGESSTANYKDVSTGKTKHVEVCKIAYNPKIISYDILLAVFFYSHDPTQLNRQGNDIGPQYQSAIFYLNNEEKNQCKKYIEDLEFQKIYENIKTNLIKFENFYKAEEYHQNYFQLNSNQPYCSIIINPKVEKLKKKFKNYYPKKIN
tara:strand:- start:22271 stop:22828 length:558 start_codon:yes stop_codon:yes gene_type:complete